MQEAQALKLAASAQIYVRNSKRFREDLRQLDYNKERGVDVNEPLD